MKLEQTVAHPTAEHVPALHGLRGLAALSVALGHGIKTFGFERWGQPNVADYGVFIFFCLSGFLMGHLYLGRPATRATALSYATARVGRIVPLYFLVAIGSFLIYSFVDRAWFYQVDGLQLIRLLTFMSSYSVFWSVAPEFQFYAVFAAIWWLSSRAANKAALWTALAAISVVMALLCPLLPGFLVFSKMHIFMTGVLLAPLRNLIVSSPVPAWAVYTFQAAALATLAILFVDPPMIHDMIYPQNFQVDPRQARFYGSISLTLIVAFIVLAFSMRSLPFDRAFGTGPTRFLGAISFSLYLLHEPIFAMLQRFPVVETYVPLTRALIWLPIAIAVSWLSYRVIEKPASLGVRRWGEALSRRLLSTPRIVSAPILETEGVAAPMRNRPEITSQAA